jgi:hypothetical protein
MYMYVCCVAKAIAHGQGHLGRWICTCYAPGGEGGTEGAHMLRQF